MPAPSPPLVNLVLKRWQWRQQGLDDLSAVRVPASYRPLLVAARGQRCVIYVPHRAWPDQRAFEGQFIANGYLDGMITDPHDRSMLIASLGGLQRFTRPVPLKIDGDYVLTRDAYGFQDKSLEQQDVVAISPSALQRLLMFGTTVAAFLPTDAESEPKLLQGQGMPHSGLREEPRRPRYVFEKLARMEGLRRSTYVRIIARLIDAGTCIICDFTAKLRRSYVAIDVVHFHPLGKRGSDDITNTSIMCARCHRLYDSFAFALSDTFGIIRSRHLHDQHSLALADPNARATFRRPPDLLPDLKHIRWHREQFEQNEAKLDRES